MLSYFSSDERPNPPTMTAPLTPACKSDSNAVSVGCDALFDNSGMLAIARVKKPHRHFLAGDLVVGERRDGMADNLVCWGWSSKHCRIVGGRWGYRLRYCGWEQLPRRFQRAAENAKFEDSRKYAMIVPNGRGHLYIVKWFNGRSLNDEHPPQLRDEAWLRRLLIELLCGNMPLSRKEAAPSKRTFLSNA
jgi:hypothetical protein